MTKTCPGDGRKPHTLSVSEFTKNASRADGLSVYCKTCAAAKQRRWKHEHPEEVRKAKADYRQREKQEREAAA